MSAQIDYKYDIFVSYSHRNRAWVHDWFLPRLDANFKVCIDSRNFIPGYSVSDNIQRAVKNSRHTLAVLTTAWVESEWSELESLLARHRDPAARRRRLIPLMLEPCSDQLPPSVDLLTYADFTDYSQHERLFEQLLGQIQSPEDDQPPRASEKNYTQSALMGLQALIAVARTPVVQATAEAFQSVFQSARLQIKSLGDDKALHDFFQRLELCYNLIYQNGRRVLTDEAAWDDLEVNEFNLEGIVDEWVSAADRAAPPADPPSWMKKVMRALQEMRNAINQKDHQLLKSAVRRLIEVLGREPSRVNTRMAATAKALSLGAMAKASAAVRARLATASPGYSTSDRLREIEAGVDALIKLEETLKLHIDHHDLLQQIDDDLRRVETQLDLNVDEISDSWEYSRSKIEDLPSDSASDWAIKLREAAAELQAALEAGDAVRTRRAFRRFRSQGNRSFNQVDRDLLALCGELQAIGEQLAYLLKLLQGDDARE
jgi:hypothetical protein